MEANEKEPMNIQLSTPSEPQSMTQADFEAAARIRASYATGDYGHCLELARRFASEKGRSAAFKAWLHNQLQTILTALGWLRLKTGRCDQAIELLKEAETIHPSLEVAKGLAYCNYTNHNLDIAEDNIIWFMQHTKRADADILSIYAEVLESKNRFGEAAKILEALAKERDDPSLKKKIEGMKAKASKSNLYQTINSRFFSITFEEEAHRDIAEKTQIVLDKALDDLIANYKFREPKKPVEVLLYPEQDFKSFNPESPLWAEALFNGRIRVPLHAPYDLNRLQTVLRHELVHALFSQMTGGRNIPNWFEEGVAQLASGCSSKGCIPFKFNNTGKFLSEETFGRPFVSYEAQLAHQVYAQSLYLVLTLERYKGLQPIIESILIDSSLDSNDLLKQVKLSFSELRTMAEQYWNKRYNFAN